MPSLPPGSTLVTTLPNNRRLYSSLQPGEYDYYGTNASSSDVQALFSVGAGTLFANGALGMLGTLGNEALIFGAAITAAGSTNHYLLYGTDGTSAGTHLLLNDPVSTGDGSYRLLGTVAGRDVFYVRDGATYTVYGTDGTAAGTQSLFQATSSSGSTTGVELVASATGSLTVASWSGTSSVTYGTDGTKSGTQVQQTGTLSTSGSTVGQDTIGAVWTALFGGTSGYYGGPITLDSWTGFASDWIGPVWYLSSYLDGTELFSTVPIWPNWSDLIPPGSSTDVAITYPATLNEDVTAQINSLVVGRYSVLNITGALTVASSISNAGTLSVTGGQLFLGKDSILKGPVPIGLFGGGTLVFDDTVTADNATINLGGAQSGYGGAVTDLDTDNSKGKTLTFGSGLTINSTANTQGTLNYIGVDAYQSSSDQAEGIVNKGTINALSGTLALQNVANQGTINVSAGAMLQGGVTSSGVINNSGGVIAVGSTGSALITSGTIISAGAISGILSVNNGYLFLANNVAFKGAGTGTATINVGTTSGGGGTLVFDDTVTADNATINLGGAQSGYGGAVTDLDTDNSKAKTLTFGSGLTINSTANTQGTLNYIGVDAYQSSSDQAEGIVNKGTINALSGTLALQNVANQGTINVSAGAMLQGGVTSSGVINNSGGVIAVGSTGSALITSGTIISAGAISGILSVNNGYLFLANNVAFKGAGTGTATINVGTTSGGGGTLVFDDTVTADNATINLGGAQSGYGGAVTDLDTDNSKAKTLTFGSGLTINSTANTQGTLNYIGVDAYQSSSDQAEGIVNKGTINALSGTLALQNVANQGTINVSAGAMLQGGVTSSGVINNSGGVIAVGSTGSASTTSGTIISAGAISGILSVNNGYLFLANNVAFKGAGTGTATINVGTTSGGGGTLVFDDTVTADNATINLGGAQSGYGGAVTDLDTDNSKAKTLTFGSGLTINSTANTQGTLNYIGVDAYQSSSDQAEGIVNKGTINALSGTLALQNVANQGTINVSAGAMLQGGVTSSGVINNSGGVIAVGSTGSASTTSGTIISAGAISGILSVNNGYLFLANNVAFKGAGTGTATINVGTTSGGGGTLVFDDTVTADNATINLGGAQSGYGGAVTDLDTDNSKAKTLTFGSGLTINSTANTQGTLNYIGVDAYQSSSDQAEGIVNKGTINALSGTLALQNVANQGTINVSAGAMLQGGVTSSGVINNSGGVIAVGSTGSASTTSGTIISAGAISGILSVNNGYLFLANNVAFKGAGTGTATINVGTTSGGGGTLVFDDTVTADNATINLGGAQSGYGGAVTDLDTDNSKAKTLTFGSGLTINSTANTQGTLNYIGVDAYQSGSDQAEGIVNKGTINALSGTLAIAASLFTNQSTITVANGATLSIQTATSVNQGTVNLSGGTLTLGMTAPSGSGRIAGFGTINLGGPTANLVEASGGTLALTGAASGAFQIDASATLDAQAATGSVTFAGAAGTLVLHPTSATNQGAPLQLAISGFTANDRIDLAGVTVTKATYQATGGASGTLSLYSGTSSLGTITLAGNYAGEHFAVTPDGSGNGYDIVAAGRLDDFNNDGKSDILLQNDNGAIVIETTTGLSVTGGGLLYNPGPTSHVVASADLNGDGQNDLLLQNDNGAIVDYLMNGATITAATVLTNPGPTWHVRGTGDFNADGKADILLQNDNGLIFVEYTDGASILGGASISNPGPSWTVEGVADFNGDGQPDLLLQNTNGTLVDFLMNGPTPAAGFQLLGPNAGYSVAGTGNYNGDNRADILLHNDNGTDVILDTNGQAIIGSSAPIGNPGPTWTTAVAGIDYNGDGASDILIENTSGALVGYTLDSSGAVTAGATLTTAGAGWRALGGPPIQFIDATGNTPTLAATPGPDEFNFTSFTAGIHTITNFDAATDLIALSAAAVTNYANVQAHESAYNGGTAIGLSANAAIVIQGVTPDQLSSANFVLR